MVHYAIRGKPRNYKPYGIIWESFLELSSHSRGYVLRENTQTRIFINLVHNFSIHNRDVHLVSFAIIFSNTITNSLN